MPAAIDPIIKQRTGLSAVSTGS